MVTFVGQIKKTINLTAHIKITASLSSLSFILVASPPPPPQLLEEERGEGGKGRAVNSMSNGEYPVNH